MPKKRFVLAVRQVNEEMGGRVEYLITNFEYRDAIEYLSTLFRQEFHMVEVDDDDELWRRTLTLRRGFDEFYLAWHEDIGTYLYCKKQDKQSLREFEYMINTVLTIVNKRFGRTVY